MSNKPKTRGQKCREWVLARRQARSTPTLEEAWTAGYLAGHRARQYEGDQRGRVQRADQPR